jgi:hypothetical protein
MARRSPRPRLARRSAFSWLALALHPAPPAPAHRTRQANAIRRTLHPARRTPVPGGSGGGGAGWGRVGGAVHCPLPTGLWTAHCALRCAACYLRGVLSALWALWALARWLSPLSGAPSRVLGRCSRRSALVLVLSVLGARARCRAGRREYSTALHYCS